MGILFVIVIGTLLELIQILSSKNKIGKWILPSMSFLFSIFVILGIFVFEKHGVLNNKIDISTVKYNILYVIIFNIPTLIFTITNFIMNKKKNIDKDFYKKIKISTLITLIMMIILFVFIQLSTSKHITKVNEKENNAIQNTDSESNYSTNNLSTVYDANGNNVNQLNREKEDITKTIINKDVSYRGIISLVNDNYIYFVTEDFKNLYFEKSKFTYTNGRTSEDMNIEEIKAGDYICVHHERSFEVFRNITGEEWEKECIKNLAYCYEQGSLICNPQQITKIQNMGDYVIITLIMEDSTTKYFNGKDSEYNTFELNVIAYANLNIPTYSGGVTIYNLKEEVEGFMFWIGLDKNTINNKYPVINDIHIYDK